jgi:hypothetical protein
MGKSLAKKLTASERDHLLSTLKERFEKNMQRHKGISWNQVEARLNEQQDKLWSLQAMEATGGEPDVVQLDKKSGAFVFFDCAAESPAGRRSLCYDEAALDARKENKPAGSAVGLAAAMGIELLTEEQYRFLQQTGAYDLKTSSWIETPPAIRKLGGALFGDRRYDAVFIYHNGVQSYYGARGFRGSVTI